MIASKLPLKTKLAYGIGEMGTVIPISISVFFLLFFLTNVAGLSPQLAGSVLLLGRGWDAINDPLIGWLSDRTQSRWGRRYPWIIGGAGPLALCCALQWRVPPIESQVGLLLYYSAVSLVAYAAFSAVQLPFSALAAELTSDYDDRTALMGYKAGFNIAGSVLGLVIAQGVFSTVNAVQWQYGLVGVISSFAVLLGLAISVWGTHQRHRQLHPSDWGTRGKRPSGRSADGLPGQSFWSQIPSLWANRPFLWLMGLYLCSWMGVQVTAAMLPYFVTSWMGLPTQHFTQMAIVVQGTAVIAMPVWMRVTQKTSKKTTYLVGASLAMMGLLGVSGLQPGQIRWMYGWALLIGSGVSTFYLVPLAMLPDVIDYDALQTGERREGLYFSFLVFFQKVGLAIALFVIGWLLEVSGFLPTQGSVGVDQPISAIWTIRVLMGIFPAVLIGIGGYFALRYPLSRQRYQEIQRKLDS